MGIQAPTTQDQITIAYSALISYNRPIILLSVFLASFIISYVVLKKSSRRILFSVLIAGAITVLTAMYFILTMFSNIRY